MSDELEQKIETTPPEAKPPEEVKQDSVLVKRPNNDHASWLAEAKAPLVTIEDCYDALDAFYPHETPTFAEIQQAYRHQLYKYNPDKLGLAPISKEYRTLKTERVKEAYRRICETLGENPETGLIETEESLLAERDNRLKGWAGHWCGTPSLQIHQEYKERIEALKDKGI